MRVAWGVAGGVLLIAAAVITYQRDRWDSVAARLGAVFGVVLLAVLLGTIATVFYQRYVADDRRVNLRSPYFVLTIGVLSVILATMAVGREQRERRGDAAKAAEDAKRCERRRGSPLDQLPAEYRHRPLPPPQLAALRRQVPEELAGILKARDIYVRGTYVATVILASVGDDPESRRDFLAGAREGAEITGETIRRRVLGGSQVIAFRTQGIVNYTGLGECHGVTVLTRSEARARDLWLALATR